MASPGPSRPRAAARPDPHDSAEERDPDETEEEAEGEGGEGDENDGDDDGGGLSSKAAGKRVAAGGTKHGLDLDSDQEGAPAKKKARRATKPEETATQAQARLEKLGKQISIERDVGPKPSGAILDPMWRERLAQHLVREPSFLRLMENPIAPEHVGILMKWLAAVLLPWRYKNTWNLQAWFNKFKATDSSRIAFVERAMAIYHQVFRSGPVPEAGSFTGVATCEAPGEEGEDASARADFFHHNTARQRLVATIKNITDLENVSARELTNPALDKPTAGVSELVRVLAKLETAKNDMRVKLNTSRVAELVRSRLDELLELTPYGTRMKLWQVPTGSLQEDEGLSIEFGELETDEAVQEGEDPELRPSTSSRRLDDQQIDSMIARINEKFPFTLEWVEGKPLGDSRAIFFSLPTISRGPNRKKGPMAPISTSSSKGRATPEASRVIEQRVCGHLTKLLAAVDYARFKANMRLLEDTETRPTVVAEKAGSSAIAGKNTRLLYAKDNLYHVRALVSIMHRHGLLVSSADGSVDINALQLCLHRMWALVALMHGCIAEGAALLSSMDTLLEELANLVIGHKDPIMSTVTMRRLPQILHKLEIGQMKKVPKGTSSETMENMEREDRATRIFSEITRFYRGAVLLAYSSVNWTNSTQVSKDTWYAELLKWDTECGSSFCLQRLAIKADTGGVKALGFQLPESQIGFREERATISTNREWAYPNLSEFISKDRWQPGWGPVAHYYGHVYHTACKPFRGKVPLLQTVDKVQAASEEGSSSKAAEGDGAE